MTPVAPSSAQEGAEPRVIRSVSAQEEERQVKRSRREPPHGDDDEMGGLVEYGFDECKNTATTHVHITMHDGH